MNIVRVIVRLRIILFIRIINVRRLHPETEIQIRQQTIRNGQFHHLLIREHTGQLHRRIIQVHTELHRLPIIRQPEITTVIIRDRRRLRLRVRIHHHRHRAQTEDNHAQSVFQLQAIHCLSSPLRHESGNRWCAVGCMG